MRHALSLLGLLDPPVEVAETKNTQRLVEMALAVGPVDMQPGEFYADVLAVMAEGVDHPEEFAAAALGIVRGAETINAMIAGSEPDGPNGAISCEQIMLLDHVVIDAIEMGPPNGSHSPASANRLLRRWF